MDRTEELRASPPMFNSALLDRFTRVHPAVPVLIYAPVIALLLLTGEQRVGLANSLGLMLGGYAVWTLTEYWLHRVVFHFEPQRGIGARLHWMIHGVHHDHPNDPLRLVMPPSASVPLATAFCLVFWLVLGSDHAPAFSAGFLAGYLAYDMVHYHVHHHRPRTRVGRRLRELHMRHHFQDDESGFGVSAPYWDRVFGTEPRAAELGFSRRGARRRGVRHKSDAQMMRSMPIRSATRGNVGSLGSKLIQHWRRKYSLGGRRSQRDSCGFASNSSSMRSRIDGRPATARLEDEQLEIGEAFAHAAHDEAADVTIVSTGAADGDAQRGATDDVVGHLVASADVWRSGGSV